MSESWHTVNLGDVCTKITDGSHNPPKGVDSSDWMMLSSKNVFDDEITFDKPRFLSEEDFRSENKRTSVAAGDVLLTIVGTIGRCAVVPSNAQQFTLQRSVAVLKPDPSSVDSRFLMFALRRILSELNDGARGVAQKGIYLKALREQQIQIPPLPEQKRIVAILDEAFAGIDQAIANTERSIENARELFTSRQHSLFMQNGDKLAGKRLEELCSFSSGGTPSKKNADYWGGDIPWVSGRDMKSTQISDSALHTTASAVEESAARLVPAGTLLVLVRGMGLAHGAQIAELTAECAFNQDIKALHPSDEILPKYLLYALKTRINSSDTVMSNAAHGTMKIDMSELKSVLIPVRALDSQMCIVKQIDSLAESVERLVIDYQQKLNSLENLKRSILGIAFKGKLRGA